MSEKKKDRNKIGNVAELASLRKEVEYLRAENAYLKKIAGLSKGKECPTNRERG